MIGFNLRFSSNYTDDTSLNRRQSATIMYDLSDTNNRRCPDEGRWPGSETRWMSTRAPLAPNRCHRRVRARVWARTLRCCQSYFSYIDIPDGFPMNGEYLVGLMSNRADAPAINVLERIFGLPSVPDPPAPASSISVYVRRTCVQL